MIRCDSFSEPPGFLLGTSWTVRIAMLMDKEEKKKKKSIKSEFFDHVEKLPQLHQQA
jgi:hypothetical protein